MLKNLSLSRAWRVDSRSWWYIGIVSSTAGPNIRCAPGGIDSVGSAFAGTATTAPLGFGRYRLDCHIHCQLHRHHFDGFNLCKKAKLRCSTESGMFSHGSEQHCRRFIFVCAKWHIVVTFVDSRADRWSNTDCQRCIGISDFDHFAVDWTIFRGASQGMFVNTFSK